jgi:hypothetical protein
MNRAERWAAWTLWLLAACDPSRSGAPDASVDSGAIDQPLFCAREGADEVRDLFCVEAPPRIASLNDLQVLLDLMPRQDGSSQDGAQVAMLGHSTALSGQLVSPINPRVILIGVNTIGAFQRGVQRVELVTNDRISRELKFYLLSFEQACNERERGCSAGDLYTPQLEQAWTGVAIQDDEDLKNTPADCRQCHQRGREQPTLLMRELNSPWTHFLFQPGADATNPGAGGGDLASDYLNARGDERIAGAAIDELNPAVVFTLQRIAGEPQPLLFDAPAIMNERYPVGADKEGPALPSPTWEAAYEAFKRGEQLALPYVETRVTDPVKQAALTSAYQSLRAGEIEADELPDLADIFPDDPMTRARIGLQTEPGATPQEALIQACGSCHNDVLDQSLSRARFNIDVSRLDRIELDIAIERIQRDSTEDGAMPPPEARALDSAARAMLIEYLRDPARSAEPDPALQRAAQLGMAGGAGP